MNRRFRPGTRHRADFPTRATASVAVRAAIAILARVITFGSVVVIGGLWSLLGTVREHLGAPAFLRPVTGQPDTSVLEMTD